MFAKQNNLMEFIDSHTHLYAEEFNNDRLSVIEEAISKGIKKMILPNIDAETIPQMMATVQVFPENCFPALGLHPTSVKQDYKKQLDAIFHLLPQINCVGIGEIGIDLYWDKTYLEQQIDAFKTQIIKAQELNLPVIIHCRESFDVIMEALNAIPGPLPTGIFHSFTGSAEQAQKIIDLNFLIGINGVITYKNSKLDEVITNIPLENIVLETDSPYLTPVPFRGKRNNSSYLIYIAQKIADVKKVPIEQVASITTQNTENTFRL
jgi:TatD DNase family protein